MTNLRAEDGETLENFSPLPSSARRMARVSHAPSVASCDRSVVDYTPPTMTTNLASVPSSWTPVGSTCNTDYFLVGEDVLIVLPHPRSSDDGPSARENVDFQMALAGRLGRPLGFVIAISSLTSQDSEARRVYAEGMLPERSRGAALVVQSMLARAMASFFMGLTKPRIPTCIVGSIEEGIARFATEDREGAE